MTALAPLETRLLNEFQSNFPLAREPYAAIARRLGVEADWVRERLAARIADGTVSRVGAVFRPGAIGASTLAAMAVPAHDIERVASVVSSRPEVNHNYEREHRLNLWFVATAADRLRLDAALAQIARDSGIVPIALPLATDYAIDLGFDFVGRATDVDRRHNGRSLRAARSHERRPLCAADARLIAVLEDGLQLVDQPYRAIAERAGVAQLYVMTRLADWLSRGVIKRFGIVVRHRALGYVANAMCVWDAPDSEVDATGAALACEPYVTLCYRRARSLPEWPYNLFCMIHGRDRSNVLSRIERLSSAHRLDRYESAVLFSRRAFKQCGARYASLSTQPASIEAAALAA